MFFCSCSLKSKETNNITTLQTNILVNATESKEGKQGEPKGILKLKCKLTVKLTSNVQCAKMAEKASELLLRRCPDFAVELNNGQRECLRQSMRSHIWRKLPKQCKKEKGFVIQQDFMNELPEYQPRMLT